MNSHPLSQQVALMIKTFPPHGFHPEWHWLQLRAAEDPRIHLVVASFEREELLALYRHRLRRQHRFLHRPPGPSPAVPTPALMVLADDREAAAGAGYRAQLEELWAQRQELAGRLKWRTDTAA